MCFQVGNLTKPVKHANWCFDLLRRWTFHTLFFFRWYMYVNSFLDISVHFKSKTNLLFIRERIIIPVYVYSLSECAMRCFCPTKCISFFNENFDLFCQWKAKSYVSLIAALQIHGSIAVIITLPLKWRYIYEFNTCNT